MKGSAKVPLKSRSDLNKPAPLAPLADAKPTFKAGGALPSISDDIEKKENKSKVKF